MRLSAVLQGELQLAQEATAAARAEAVSAGHRVQELSDAAAESEQMATALQVWLRVHDVGMDARQSTSLLVPCVCAFSMRMACPSEAAACSWLAVPHRTDYRHALVWYLFVHDMLSQRFRWSW